MSDTLKKLSYDDPSFAKIIRSNYLYVDKTKIIADLVDNHAPLLLTRPRGFGKTLLVDTLYHYFKGDKELFKDTYIGRNNLFPQKDYKVVRLDLSTLKHVDDNFGQAFVKILRESLELAGIDCAQFRDNLSAGMLLSFAVASCPTMSIVLLIDGYDEPLTAVLDNSKELEKRFRVLANFFTNVKSKDGKFNFVLITGVTHFSFANEFSGFNNYIDISLRPKYGALLGFTQEELETCFKDRLESATHALNKAYGENKYTVLSLLEKLRHDYEGYCFDDYSYAKVYNPYTILSFFDAIESSSLSYVSDSAQLYCAEGKTNFLKEYLSREYFEAQRCERYINLDCDDVISAMRLKHGAVTVDSNDFDYKLMLYHMGFLSLKKRSVRGLLYVGIPNFELKKTFARAVIDLLASRVSKDFAKELEHDFVHDLKDCREDEIKGALNTLINTLSYKTLAHFDANSYRDLLATTLTASGATVVVKKNGDTQDVSCLYVELEDYAFDCKVRVVTSMADLKEADTGDVVLALDDNEEEIAKEKLQAGTEIKAKSQVEADVEAKPQTGHRCDIVILHQVGTDKSDSRFEVCTCNLI